MEGQIEKRGRSEGQIEKRGWPEGQIERGGWLEGQIEREKERKKSNPIGKSKKLQIIKHQWKLNS